VDYWYSGQIRKYILQTIRFLSNFQIKQGDGTLIRVPVTYGDMDRQAASVLNQNSENAMISAPKISVYITNLELDRDRLGDSTFVGKISVRERDIDNGAYTGDQGGNYTVERLMPTPFTLEMKVDVWTTNADQKLQILEQILMFFNPSLEIQTSDNYLDWTSLSILNLTGMNFSSRTVPIGTSTAIDIATLTLQTPIWISPPAKVKKLGVVTNVITTLYDQIDEGDTGYIEGLGVSLGITDPYPVHPIMNINQTIGNYDLIVTGKNVLAISKEQGSNYVSWYHIVGQMPGDYQAGLAKIYLIQPDGSEVAGLASINPLNESILTVSDWDPDTYPPNTLISGPSRNNTSWGSFDAVIDPTTSKPQNVVAGTRYLIINNIGGGVRVPALVTYNNISPITSYSSGSGAIVNVTLDIYNGVYSISLVSAGSGYSVGSQLKIKGNFLGGNIIENDCVMFVRGVDGLGAIIDFRVAGLPLPTNFTIVPDAMILANSTVTYELFLNEDGPATWKNSDNSDFIADANDIIEWDGTKWVIIFDSDVETDLTYQTNLYTLTQYKFINKTWVKSFEGEYQQGQWRITL
jgi:hypothetical protein